MTKSMRREARILVSQITILAYGQAGSGCAPKPFGVRRLFAALGCSENNPSVFKSSHGFHGFH